MAARKHVYRFGPFELDVLRRGLFRNSQLVPLPPKAIDLLLILVSRPGELLDKETLLHALWPDTVVEEANLTQQIFTIRKNLGEQSNGRPYIETVVRRGYVFAAPVEEIQEAEARPGERAPRRLRPLLATVAAVCAVAAVTVWPWWRDVPAQSPVITSVAVLPLRQSTRSADDAALADSIMELLINELSANPSLKVTSRTSALYHRDSTLPLKAIARSLGVDGIVEGSLMRSGERVRVAVRLIHAPTDRTVWARTFDRNANETLALQTEIARAITPDVVGGRGASASRSRQTADSEAFDLYLQGRHHWNQRTRESLHRSVELFTAATRKDPGYATAYAALANAYGVMVGQNLLPAAEGQRRAEIAARRALELDPNLADAWLTLAAGQTHYRWDFAAAGKSYRRALELNPSLATAHQWYAHYLQVMGRPDDAIAHMRRAVELDPLSPVVHHAFALLLTRAGRYEEAIARNRRGLEIDSRPGGRRSLILAYEASGNFAAAAAELKKAPDLSGISASEADEIAIAYATGGAQAYFRKRLEILLRRDKRDFVSPVDLAGYHARAGNDGEAMRCLERAFSERSSSLVFLQVDPALATLRPRSDFKRLVARIGLPPAN